MSPGVNAEVALSSPSVHLANEVDQLELPGNDSRLPPLTTSEPAKTSAIHETGPPPTGRTHLLMTLPVYNEVERLTEAVREVAAALDVAEVDYRLAIAEDGSTDGTKALIARLCQEFPSMIVQMLAEKRGRGYALRSLWSKVDADIYAFSDVDLATGTDSLLRAIQLAGKGIPVVTGSRYVPGAVVNRPPLRYFVSQQYNRLTRLWFGDNLQDHQCGLKVFTREALGILLPMTTEDSWFWDTEVLVRARQFGIEVKEIPVNWSEKKDGKTRLSRLVSDVILHGTGLLRLKARMTASGAHLSGDLARTPDWAVKPKRADPYSRT